MPASATTQNYGLHIYRPGDTCNYLQTYNEDMTKIDTQMKANQTAGNGNATQITTLAQSVNALDVKVNQQVNTIAHLYPKRFLSPYTAGQNTEVNIAYLIYDDIAINGTIFFKMKNPHNWDKLLTRFTNSSGAEFFCVGSVAGNPLNITRAIGINNWQRVGWMIAQYPGIWGSTGGSGPELKVDSNWVFMQQIGVHLDNNITYFSFLGDHLHSDPPGGTTDYRIRLENCLAIINCFINTL